MKKSTLILIGVVLAVLLISFFIGKGITGGDGVWEDALYTEDTELGEGAKTISVKVAVGKKNVTFTIHTDKKTVGEALEEHDLIEGEDGPYGIYVKKVNGIEADFDFNKAYWAFSKDSKPLEKGVDMEKVKDGAKYELVYTK